MKPSLTKRVLVTLETLIDIAIENGADREDDAILDAREALRDARLSIMSLTERNRKQTRLRRLTGAFAYAGGRGVELADEIDALRWELGLD